LGILFFNYRIHLQKTIENVKTIPTDLIFYETNQPTNTTIEETLVLNGVVYDDIKLELVDHIATEIEEISSGEKPLRLF
jgi:hypothetical protein